MQTVTLSLFRFGPAIDRAWAFLQMALARPALARTPGIGFWKLFGSGTGEGFTPIPNTAVWGILATWPDEAAARAGMDTAVFRRYRSRAQESWTVFLAATSARGKWSGREPFAVSAEPGTPVAALTRATIRPGKALKFWSAGPAISLRIGANPDVMFKIGLGEVPWLHQMTFSIWPDARSMAAFARADGPHAQAIRGVREGNWFSEELYARFRILGDTGRWEGRRPLAEAVKDPIPA